LIYKIGTKKSTIEFWESMPLDQMQERINHSNLVPGSEVDFVSFEGYGKQQKLLFPVLNEPKINGATLFNGKAENRRYETHERLSTGNSMPKESSDW